jgi:hypothetical protein
MIERTAELRSDLVEYLRRDLELEVRLAQRQGRVLEGPARHRSDPQGPEELRPGRRVANVAVCHSFNSGFASMIFGFLMSWSLKWSTTAAIG